MLLASNDLSNKSFLKWILILLVGYVLIEILLIPHIMLCYDEFWFTQHIYQYTQHIPYRDFLPYKTVLGYYLLTLPFYFSQDLLAPIFLMKDELALLNGLVLAGSAIYLGRFFNRKAILLTLILIFCNQFFLFHSVEVRVDMLACNIGLMGILFLLSKKNIFAGFLLGISFLVSQKALWLIFSINVAYLISWLTIQTLKLGEGHRSFPDNENNKLEMAIDFLSWMKLNIALLIPITLYCIAWSVVAGFQSVLNSVFYEAYTQSKLTWYSQAYWVWWRLNIAHGPLLIALFPCIWFSLLFNKITPERIFILTFGTVLMGLVISYQQPFPYNLVFAIPAYLLAYSDFFSGLFALFTSKTQHRNKFFFIITGLISLYLITSIALFIFLKVVLPYYLIFLIPICLLLYLHQPKQVLSLIIMLTLFFTGIFYPLLQVLHFAIVFNNNYQKYSLILLNKILANDGGYVAGTPLLYYKKQPIIGLENLISPAIAYLYKPSTKLIPALIPSLYLYPTTSENILKSLKASSVKAYVNTDRMMYLPPEILNYLHSEYSHYWSNIYIYTPTIMPYQSKLFIKFSGLYHATGTNLSTVRIDNQVIPINNLIKLKRGFHAIQSDHFFRMKYQPELAEINLLPLFKNDILDKTIKL